MCVPFRLGIAQLQAWRPVEDLQLLPRRHGACHPLVGHGALHARVPVNRYPAEAGRRSDESPLAGMYVIVNASPIDLLDAVTDAVSRIPICYDHPSVSKSN